MPAKLSSPRICKIEDCEKAAIARGWCQMHYCRWKTHGNPETIGKQWKLTPKERLYQYIEKTDTCWLWTGNTDSLGYGRLFMPSGTVLAHRLSYQFHKGEVPQDLELDHLCRVRHCVNPDHLEPVSHQENVLRAKPSTCPRGHDYDRRVKNPDGSSKRVCSICRRASQRRFEQQKRLART